MPPAARLGDLTAHGGVLRHGEPSVLIGGRPAARLGDPHICPLAAPALHLGGLVIGSSATVLIRKSLAARLGDSCACFSASTVAVGVPPVVGSGPEAESEIVDSDGDGAPEYTRATGRLARGRVGGCADLGASDFCAHIQSEIGKGEAEAEVRAGDGGVAARARVEGAAMEHEGQLSVGPSGSQRANPDAAIGAKLKVLGFEAGYEGMVGRDKDRYGYSYGAKAEWEPVAGQVNTDFTIPIGGYSLRVKAYAEGDLGGLGGGLQEGKHWDASEDRFHWTGMIALEVLLGFELGFDISFGKDYPSELWATIVGRFPNSIVTGDATVLIG